MACAALGGLEAPGMSVLEGRGTAAGLGLLHLTEDTVWLLRQGPNSRAAFPSLHNSCQQQVALMAAPRPIGSSASSHKLRWLSWLAHMSAKGSTQSSRPSEQHAMKELYPTQLPESSHPHRCVPREELFPGRKEWAVPFLVFPVGLFCFFA